MAKTRAEVELENADLLFEVYRLQTELIAANDMLIKRNHELFAARQALFDAEVKAARQSPIHHGATAEA